MKWDLVSCAILLAMALLPTMLHAQEPPVEEKAGSEQAQKPVQIDLSQFTLTFSDEFEGERLDPDKWEAPEMLRQGTSRWVKSLVAVRDGNLYLGARRREGDSIVRYDCGAVRTQRDYDASKTMFWQRYGYFEARVKMPRHIGADYWAAFWLLCGKIGDEQPDTRKGLEVDIFESFHLATGDAMKMSFHWNGYGAKHNVAGFTGRSTPELKDGEFHTYGMYWDEKVYVLFIDGVEVGRTDLLGLGSGEDGKTKSQGPCQLPGYVKLSVEAAPWAGATNVWEKEQPEEDWLVVDYVRVYQGTLP